jgi:hypothetical protein
VTVSDIAFLPQEALIAAAQAPDPVRIHGLRQAAVRHAFTHN